MKAIAIGDNQTTKGHLQLKNQMTDLLTVFLTVL